MVDEQKQVDAVTRKSVFVCKSITASPEALWAFGREFFSNWHPFIEWVKEERDHVRAFKVKGENSIYRERMTYFSDSDCELHYCHLEGIRDVVSYKATFRIIPEGENALIEWCADILAPEPRASEIAQGTEAVFEAGLAALAELATLNEITIAGTPKLSAIYSPLRTGPLLLFLHGIGGNKNNWRQQVLVAAKNHQAVSIDLRGYGASDLGPSQSTIEDHCLDIQRVMAAFGKNKVILCGLSLGAWVATSFAMRYPEMVAGLILSGGCTGMSEASEEERKAFLSARQKPLDEGQSPKDFADNVVKVIAGPHASSSVLLALKTSMAAIPAATYRDALWCFTHPPERFDFSRIACPVLLMTGEHDRLASPAEIHSVAARIHQAAQAPDVRFEVIPSAGHLCNLENPSAYNQHLTQFLQRLAI